MKISANLLRKSLDTIQIASEPSILTEEALDLVLIRKHLQEDHRVIMIEDTQDYPLRAAEEILNCPGCLTEEVLGM